MNENPGYYQGQTRTSASAGQQASGQNKVGKDSPYFIARKQMFSKFPEEWKRKICSEEDNDKRLVLFNNYCRQIKLAEEHRNRQSGLQRVSANHVQQVAQSSNQDSHLARTTMLAPRLDDHGNISSSRPMLQSYHPSQPQDQIFTNGTLMPREPRTHRLLPTTTTSGGIKRVHNAEEHEYAIRTNVKRIKQEDQFIDDGFDAPDYREMQHDEQMILGQQSPGGTVYIQQKLPDGQVRIVPATVVEPISAAKPLYVQTSSGNPQVLVHQAPIRRQNVAYPNNADVRKVVSNFTSSPLASPASSASSDPEGTIRTVPDTYDHRGPEQSRFRRMLTPNGIIEERINSPFQESNRVQQPPEHVRPNVQQTHFNRINAMRSTPSPQETFSSGSTYSDQASITQQNTMQKVHQQNQHQVVQTTSTTQQIGSSILDDLRKNPEYKELIGSLRKKYAEDIKRLMARSQLDGKFSKPLATVMQILSFKIPLTKDRWNKFEDYIKEVIESSGICYPLYAELKRYLKNPCYTQNNISSRSSIYSPSSIDPWKICRDQVVHVPQFVLDVVNDGT